MNRPAPKNLNPLNLLQCVMCKYSIYLHSVCARVLTRHLIKRDEIYARGADA